MSRLFSITTAILLTAALSILAACAGGGGSGTQVPGATTVRLRNVQFQPAEVTIRAGETVTWVWEDGGIEHDVSGDGFESGRQSAGNFSHTFEEAGTYPYVCSIHPSMTGTVTVGP
jgi:plastocyanin